MILHGTIISPSSSHHKKTRWIFIRDGTIKDIFAKRPKIDDEYVEGKYILPGLINAHLHHFCENDDPLIMNGITTVRDMGMPIITFKILQVLRKKDGVRRVCCGPILTVPGGYPLNFSSGSIGLAVSGSGDSIEKTKRLVGDGVDFIKIALTRGPMDRWPMFNKDELRVLVSSADGLGKKVVAHVDSAKEMIMGIECGVRDFAHFPKLDMLNSKQIKELVREKAVICSTLSSLRSRPKNFNIAKTNLLRFFNAGGTLTIGNDYGTGLVPSPTLFDEAETVNDLINDPQYIVKALTEHSAAACSLNNRIGLVEKCMEADLIVTKHDPTKDIGHLRDIIHVIKKGKIVYT